MDPLNVNDWILIDDAASHKIHNTRHWTRRKSLVIPGSYTEVFFLAQKIGVFGLMHARGVRDDDPASYTANPDAASDKAVFHAPRVREAHAAELSTAF